MSKCNILLQEMILYNYGYDISYLLLDVTFLNFIWLNGVIMTIQQEVESKGITRLFHFTHTNNLSSILTKGIIPRENLELDKADFVFNDDVRLDGHKNANCISISYPNAAMFYKCRQKIKGDWVLLSIAPRVLWEKTCSFYPCNAASASVSSLNPKDLVGVQSLKNMFLEPQNSDTRASLGLTNEYTTDVQAEVLVFNKIEPEYIDVVYYPNKESALKFCNINSGIAHRYYATISSANRTLFSQRHYFLR